jgi:DNA polymerase III alpha subunit
MAGADRGRPRVDWRDLEDFSEGVIALTGMPGGGGILSSAIEHSANPAEPIEAYGLARRLMERYRGRLYLEPAYHHNSLEKLVNRGLVAIAQRMDLPLVATGGGAIRPTRRRAGAQAARSHRQGHQNGRRARLPWPRRLRPAYAHLGRDAAQAFSEVAATDVAQVASS